MKYPSFSAISAGAWVMFARKPSRTVTDAAAAAGLAEPAGLEALAELGALEELELLEEQAGDEERAAGHSDRTSPPAAHI